MSKIVYERVSEGQADFKQDVEWARQHPEYWSEKFKLDVATLVAERLDQLGISQAELARRMGTSPAFVTKILRGYHNWTLETLAKAGVVLGMQWLVTSAPIASVAQAFARITEAPQTPVAVVQRRRLARGAWSTASVDGEGVADGSAISTAAA
jgi:transcriptional regulator with XRE-family HTH domain